MWSLKSEFHDMSSGYLIFLLNLPRTKTKSTRFVGMLSIAIHCGPVPWTSEFQVWLVSKHMPCTKSTWALQTQINQSRDDLWTSIKLGWKTCPSMQYQPWSIHNSSCIHTHDSCQGLPRSSKSKVSGTLNFDRTHKNDEIGLCKASCGSGAGGNGFAKVHRMMRRSLGHGNTR